MFLHVTTLSNIVTADGKEITINSWNGKNKDRGASPYRWPRLQHSLSHEHWKNWWIALVNVFLAHSNSRVLNRSLFEWHNRVPSSWKWHFHPVEDRLYAHEGLHWRVYCQQRNRTSPRQGKSKHSKTNQLFRVLPDGLQLASVFKQGPFIILQGVGASTTASISTQHTSVTSFAEERLLCSPLDQWAIQEITTSNEGQAMATAIKNGTAIAVSNGSYKDGHGTAAFILKTSNNYDRTGRIVGVNSIPGEPIDQSSYCSEIVSMSGIVETVGILCK
jgi:hypothetical protein